MTAPKPGRRGRWKVIAAAAVFVAAAGTIAAGLAFGWRPDRPKAPPLTNSAVYQNDALGLRFLVPEGWSIVSRTDPPRGPLTKVIVLAAYAQSETGHPAELEVLAADRPADADVPQLIAENSIGPANWKPIGPPQAVTVNGAAATRYTLAVRAGGRETRREVTVFRRGDRVYAFFVTFGATDSSARDAARRSVESVTWGR